MQNNQTLQQNLAQPLESQLREMYGRLAYTHKTHLKMADALIDRYTLVKRVEIGLSALSSGTLVVAAFGDSKWGTLFGAVLSTILLGLILYVKEESMGEYAQRHTETASKLWGLRERMLSLLTDLRAGADVETIRTARDDVNSQLEAIYKAAPRTDGKSYAAAQNALKNAEELYFSEKELDHLLPPALRTSQSTPADVEKS
ncbi:SLATT domain-containing protein [Aurantimicrobium sp.]|uniref:SLATT domain-containing protein n=1 Tax=Aurantimicrobium sp. TaxID=1930784 RepID=UPI002FC6370E